MSKRIKLSSTVLLFFAFAFMQNAVEAGNYGIFKSEKTDDVIIWLDILPGYNASWTPMSGTSPYQVTVINMTTGTLHAQFYTASTSAPLPGLVNGNTYRVSISRGSQVDSIIIDIIDL